jgi:hypothetical protein
MADLYRVAEWSTHFEKNRTRELKRMEWVAVPNRMDGRGYTALVDHPNAAAHLGGWLAILEIASRQKVRGQIPQDDAGIPQCLARMSRLPAAIFDEVIPRLIQIGWIECYQRDTGIPHLPAEIPHLPAESAHYKTGNNTVGKTEQGTGILSDGEWAESVCDRHPKVKNRVLAEQALMKLVANPEFDREAFDHSHIAWCATVAWTEKNGSFAPVLAEWIYDCGYLRIPEANSTDRKQAQIDAEWEAMEKE